MSAGFSSRSEPSTRRAPGQNSISLTGVDADWFADRTRRIWEAIVIYLQASSLHGPSFKPVRSYPERCTKLNQSLCNINDRGNASSSA